MIQLSRPAWAFIGDEPQRRGFADPEKVLALREIHWGARVCPVALFQFMACRRGKVALSNLLQRGEFEAESVQTQPLSLAPSVLRTRIIEQQAVVDGEEERRDPD